MYKIGESGVVSCPYNPTHIVNKLRIQKHIIKCREKYPHVKLATCVYNYTHKVKPNELLSHYEICPNKIRVEGNRYCDVSKYPSNSHMSSVSGSQSLPKFSKKVIYNCEDENWDDYDSPQEISNTENNAKLGKSTILSLTDSDEELEPLPLPKTTSKAFVFVASKQLVNGTSTAVCGTSNVLQDLAEMCQKNKNCFPEIPNDENTFTKTIHPEYVIGSIRTSCSDLYSVFDDNSTIKSDYIDDEGFVHHKHATQKDKMNKMCKQMAKLELSVVDTI